MSPIKLDDVPPLSDFSRINPRDKAEECVLQQMAAAQM
jgi:hypothetical protein